MKSVRPFFLSTLVSLATLFPLTAMSKCGPAYFFGYLVADGEMIEPACEYWMGPGGNMSFEVPPGCALRIEADWGGATCTGNRVFEAWRGDSLLLSGINSASSYLITLPGDYRFTADWDGHSEVTVHAVSTPYVLVNIKCFLEACYHTSTHSMTNTLNSAGLVPFLEPYTAVGMVLAGQGGQSFTSEQTVDWMLLELRDPTDLA